MQQQTLTLIGQMVDVGKKHAGDIYKKALKKKGGKKLPEFQKVCIHALPTP